MECKCYAFAVGGMPDPLLHPLRAKRIYQYLRSEMEGLVGMHIHDRHHTLLVFGALNDAKRARNKFIATGNHAGDKIMECELSDDGKNLTVVRNAE